MTIEEQIQALSDCEDLADAEAIQFTLLPPEKDYDTNQDDAPEEDLIVNENSIHLLGKGVLAQSAEIQVTTKNKEKQDVSISHAVHKPP